MLRRSKSHVLFILLALLVATTAMPVIPAAAQEGQRHVVQPGENLFRIALRYGLSVDRLAAANNIANNAMVYAGQILVIPTAASNAAAPTEAPGNAPANVPATDNGYYTVQPGDTLNRIASRFGLTWSQLMQANGITDPNRIAVGQRLLIPNQAPANPPAEQAAPVNPPAEAAAAPAAEQGAPQPTTGARTHVVQRGEGLAAIGRKYGLSWMTIAAANNISNPNLIYAGMVLQIPDKDIAAGGGPLPESRPQAPSSNGKLILVVLREQRVYAYQDGQLLRSVVVSTGLPATPTVQGNYAVYVKYRAQTMYGPGYYLPNVPYVMYFYKGYGLHGTYWHNNFGRPMSHGCVNLPTPEAEWFFSFAEVGTPVHVRW